MKKMFISLLMVAATISAMAAVPVWTAKANLKITSTTTNEECALNLRQSDEFTGATNAYQIEMNMEGRNVAMYAWVSSQEYGTYGLKDLEGLVIGLKAQADSYTITADKVDGTAMYLEDTETGTKYPIVNGKVADITFAAAVDNTNRFKLTFVAPESADPTICHYYNKLEVRNSNGMTVQIRNLDGTTIDGFANGDTNITTDSKVEIDLSGLAAGQYLVKWNGKDLIIQQ